MGSTRSGSFSLGQDGRLRAAVRLVSDCWLPTNKRLKARLAEKAEFASSPEEIRALLRETRKDLGLYFSCLRDFCDLFRKREGSQLEEGSLLARFENIDRDMLLEILRLPDKKSSPHSLTAIKKVQSEVLCNALTAAGVAGVLAPEHGISSEQGFGATLLRQLGHLLLAWNYPRVYERASAKASSPRGVDEAIVRYLGFSPSLLAAQVLADWGIASSAPEMKLLLMEDEYSDEEIERNFTLVTLRRLCKIGETFARVRRFKNYPERYQDWAFVKKEVEKTLSGSGWETLRGGLDELFTEYQENVPELFQAGTIWELKEPLEDFVEIHPHTVNPFLELCRPPVRAALEDYYIFSATNVDAEMRLRYFFSVTLKHTDFSGACVYTVDPALMVLLPQLKSGELHLRRAEAVDYSLASSELDTVAIAYQSAEPVVTFEKGDDQRYCSSVSGFFGFSQRLGVLYLELPALISDDLIQMTHFKALRWALQDCLEPVH